MHKNDIWKRLLSPDPPASDMPFRPEIIYFVVLVEVEITSHNRVRFDSQPVADRYEFLDCQIGGTAFYGTIVGTVDIGSLRK